MEVWNSYTQTYRTRKETNNICKILHFETIFEPHSNFAINSFEDIFSGKYHQWNDQFMPILISDRVLKLVFRKVTIDYVTLWSDSRPRTSRRLGLGVRINNLCRKVCAHVPIYTAHFALYLYTVWLPGIDVYT